MKIDVDSFVKGLNFEGLHGKSVEALKASVGSVDQKTKDEVSSWIDRARKIKNDENVPRRARRDALKDLETSDLVVKFIKALVTQMIGKFPRGTQGIAKVGFSGAGLALSMLSMKRVAIALYVIRLGLPRFIMSDKFEEFADFVHEAFENPRSSKKSEIQEELDEPAPPPRKGEYRKGAAVLQ